MPFVDNSLENLGVGKNRGLKRESPAALGGMSQIQVGKVTENGHLHTETVQNRLRYPWHLDAGAEEALQEFSDLESYPLNLTAILVEELGPSDCYRCISSVNDE